jgi:hypothetical protein
VAKYEEVLGAKEILWNMQGVAMSSKLYKCVEEFKACYPHHFNLEWLT